MKTGLTDYVRNQPSRWALALLFISMLFPGTDIALSGAFYSPDAGFTWSADGLLEFVRQTVPDIVIGSFILCLVFWVASFCGVRSLRWFSTTRVAYLLSTLLIGPALIVESLLKPYWGRARPKDIIDFGGDASYTLPWQVAHECAKNCSFVSGHAAIAFWITAYAMLLPTRWRVAGVFAGTAFGIGVGLVRVAQGAHFFSDIVAAGFIILLVNTVVAQLILKTPAHA